MKKIIGMYLFLISFFMQGMDLPSKRVKSMLTGNILCDCAQKGQRGFLDEMLAQHPLDPNLTNEFGETALLIAVRENNIDLVKLLLAHGASPNTLDDTERPLIALAIDGPSVSRKEEIIDALLYEGANAREKDTLFNSPIRCALAYTKKPSLRLKMLGAGIMPDLHSPKEMIELKQYFHNILASYSNDKSVMESDFIEAFLIAAGQGFWDVAYEMSQIMARLSNRTMVAEVLSKALVYALGRHDSYAFMRIFTLLRSNAGMPQECLDLNHLMYVAAKCKEFELVNVLLQADAPTEKTKKFIKRVLAQKNVSDEDQERFKKLLLEVEKKENMNDLFYDPSSCLKNIPLDIKKFLILPMVFSRS